jgi:hypothetical protein
MPPRQQVEPVSAASLTALPKDCGILTALEIERCVRFTQLLSQSAISNIRVVFLSSR